METLEYQVEDGIAHVTLNRPDQKNSLNYVMRVELVEAWKLIDQDPSVSVALLSAKGSAFSAGHDLKEKLTPEQEATDPGSPRVYGDLYALQKPIIVAINGPCMAQGAGLALLADIRIASERALFGWPQATRGLSSVSGPTLLARIIPRNIAMEYLLTGKRLPIEIAHQWGLVNQVVPHEDLAKVAYDVARTVASNAPLAVKAIKEAATLTAGLDPQRAFDVAWLIRQRIFRTEDAIEGRASFAEKREPVWRGR